MIKINYVSSDKSGNESRGSIWVSVGALLLYVVNFDETWNLLRSYTYANKQKISKQNCHDIFRFVILSGRSRSTTKRTSLMNMFVQMHVCTLVCKPFQVVRSLREFSDQLGTMLHNLAVQVSRVNLHPAQARGGSRSGTTLQDGVGPLLSATCRVI